MNRWLLGLVAAVAVAACPGAPAAASRGSSEIGDLPRFEVLIGGDVLAAHLSVLDEAGRAIGSLEVFVHSQGVHLGSSASKALGWVELVIQLPHAFEGMRLLSFPIESPAAFTSTEGGHLTLDLGEFGLLQIDITPEGREGSLLGGYCRQRIEYQWGLLYQVQNPVKASIAGVLDEFVVVSHVPNQSPNLALLGRGAIAGAWQGLDLRCL